MLNYNKMVYYFICDDLSLVDLKKIEDQDKKGTKVTVWNERRLTANEFRHDIQETNNVLNPNHTFTTYELDKNFYKHYNIFAKNYKLVPKNNCASIEISFTNIYIHLFKTGICFLDLGYSINSNSAQDFLNCNYFLSEMKSNARIQFVNTKWDSENKKQISYVEEEISTIEFVQRILSDFKNIHALDYKEDFKYLFSKPILFSYVFLEKEESDIKDFENISHNFKTSYKLNEEVINKSQYFENSIWYYSSSSISNISYAVEDERTNDFFKTTFIDKISNLYFLLFLHSYHQKVYLLLTTIKIREYKFSCKNADELNVLSDELLIFKQNLEEMRMKVLFQYPCSIDHQNIYYDHIQNQFNIPGLLNMLDADLDNLEKYLNSNLSILSQHKNALDEIRKTKADIILLLIASLVSFASLYDTFLKLLENLHIKLNLTANIIYALVFIIICLVIPTVINIRKNVKKIKNNKEKLKRVDAIVKMKNTSLISKQ